MNKEDLEFPAWQAPLQELILEFDQEKLPEKMHSVETAILERLQQLNAQDNSHRERQALNDALSVLKVIARNKLGSAIESRIMARDGLEI